MPARRFRYRVELLLMVLAVGPVLASAYASLVTGEGHWFQRSGSLMVLFSVAVEYHRRRGRRGLAGDAREGVEDGARPLWRSIPYVCYASIVMGTLIWGYGDLMFDSA